MGRVPGTQHQRPAAGAVASAGGGGAARETHDFHPLDVRWPPEADLYMLSIQYP